MAGRIFISYRRADSAGEAGRLYDALAQRFGAERVFMDVDSIALGADFITAIERSLTETAVMLVVLGPQWLSLQDPSGARRIDDPADLVRLEIQYGLSASVHVIPVCVDGAGIPRADELPEPLRNLSRRNGAQLRHDRWKDDVQHLITEILRTLQEEEGTNAVPVPKLSDSAQRLLATVGRIRTTLVSVTRQSGKGRDASIEKLVEVARDRGIPTELLSRAEAVARAARAVAVLREEQVARYLRFADEVLISLIELRSDDEP